MPDRVIFGNLPSTVHFLSSSACLVNGLDRKRSVVKICGFMGEL